MASFDEACAKAQAVWAAVESPAKPQIFVSYGIHGEAAGAPANLKAIQETLQREQMHADVHITGGLGLDYAENIISVIKSGKPRVFFGWVTPDKAGQLVVDYLQRGIYPMGQILGAIRAGGSETLPYTGGDFPDLLARPEMKIQTRIVTANCGIIDPTNVQHYIARGGYSALRKAVLEMQPAQVIEELDKSNLRGRGGAAFPTGTKWKFLVNAPNPKYLICNGEEGDAGTFNDKHIFESDPHRVVEGLILGGYATRANGGKGFIFIRTGWELPIRRVQKAIDEAYALGLAGKNILGTQFSFDVELAFTGSSYVAGEETAVMEAIEGHRAMPRYRPPFPAAYGLWGRPTNINNVKTYSYVSTIVDKGGQWFAGIGTQRSKGTALACLTGKVNRPGCYEVPFGTTLRQVLDEAAGGIKDGKKLKFLQTGGPLGGFLPASSVDMQIDFDAMAGAGAMFGAGGLIVGDETDSVPVLAGVLAEFNADESCGKCFPCRVGTRQVADIMERMNHGHGNRRELQAALVIGETMKSALCGHGQLAENPIKSGYKYFKEEFDALAK